MQVLTVGHSNHAPEAFLALLTRHGVTALADVRSAPRSRFNPHFNRNALSASLAGEDIAYVWLGRELGGGRTTRPATRTGRSATTFWRTRRSTARESGAFCAARRRIVWR